MALDLDANRFMEEGDPDAEEVTLAGITLTRRAYDALVELAKLKRMPVQLMAELLLNNAVEQACNVAKVQTLKLNPIIRYGGEDA